ncbi:hypothetical protein NMY22_g9617 [Coprinellus aureogranulatus]|nr:hypothetical protein NMY22_g9617 [Coprinellus aureogranulatus]
MNDELRPRFSCITQVGTAIEPITWQPCKRQAGYKILWPFPSWFITTNSSLVQLGPALIPEHSPASWSPLILSSHRFPSFLFPVFTGISSQFMSRMQRPRVIPAELDLLDSPLSSPSVAFPSATPFSASLGPMPGSALAEHIFNDPGSWETDDTDLSLDDEDGARADPMAWFIEEVERFRLGSAGTDSDGSSTAFSFTPGSVGFGLDDGEDTDADEEDASDKAALITSPDAQDEKQQQQPAVKGIKKQRKGVRPISLAALFEHASDGLPKEMQIQLEDVLKSGKLPPATYDHLKALSTGSTTPSSGDLSTAGTAASSVSDSSSLNSPVIHSASATLSFLEWYGIYPDSPRPPDPSKADSLRKSIYARRTKPHLAIPMPKTANFQLRPSSILSPSVLMPELSIEAPKRGSAVPPLRDLKPMLEQIVVNARKGAPTESDGEVETKKDDGNVDNQVHRRTTRRTFR